MPTRGSFLLLLTLVGCQGYDVKLTPVSLTGGLPSFVFEDNSRELVVRFENLNSVDVEVSDHFDEFSCRCQEGRQSKFVLKAREAVEKKYILNLLSEFGNQDDKWNYATRMQFLVVPTNARFSAPMLSTLKLETEVNRTLGNDRIIKAVDVKVGEAPLRLAFSLPLHTDVLSAEIKPISESEVIKSIKQLGVSVGDGRLELSIELDRREVVPLAFVPLEVRLEPLKGEYVSVALGLFVQVCEHVQLSHDVIRIHRDEGSQTCIVTPTQVHFMSDSGIKVTCEQNGVVIRNQRISDRTVGTIEFDLNAIKDIGEIILKQYEGDDCLSDIRLAVLHHKFET